MSGDLIGEVLDGRYRVDQRVGKGAMGAVYRGERLQLGRVVAIKVMQGEGLQSGNARARFEREAMAMAKLEHPHCGSVLDVGVHGDTPYVVMEYVDGQNLKELIEAGPIPRERAIDITRQVLSGLAHAHEHGVIHRDIKPANIVLSQKSGLGDHVKILDFGLARFNKEASNLTAGIVVGTPNYMAPEQIAGLEVDQRTDLYACGVMLFELLTGSKPFQAKDPVATCMKHLHDPPPRLGDVAQGRAWGALEDVVARALAKKPAERFASAHEFAQALQDAAPAPPRRPTPVPTADRTMALDVDDSDVTTQAPVRPRPRRGRTMLVAIVLVALAGGGVAAYLATRGDSQQAAPEPTPTAVETKPAASKEPEAAAPRPPAPDVAGAPPPAPDGADAVAALLARADGMPRQPAIDFLLDARKAYPRDARLAYRLAMRYLDKMWWADGLKQARAALALDPTLKTDAELIKLVIKGFNTTKSYDWTLAKFLREDIGAAAKPYLEDTAKNHPNKIVRARATSELRRYK